MAEQSTVLSTATTSTKRQRTARALLLGERIDLAGLERSDLISATPLAFRAGQEGYAVLFRYGAVVLIGLSVLEEDELIRSLQPRITGAFARREDENVAIEIVPDRDDAIAPGGPITARDPPPPRHRRRAGQERGPFARRARGRQGHRGNRAVRRHPRPHRTNALEPARDPAHHRPGAAGQSPHIGTARDRGQTRHPVGSSRARQALRQARR